MSKTVCTKINVSKNPYVICNIYMTRQWSSMIHSASPIEINIVSTWTMVCSKVGIRTKRRTKMYYISMWLKESQVDQLIICLLQVMTRILSTLYCLISRSTPASFYLQNLSVTSKFGWICIKHAKSWFEMCWNRNDGWNGIYFFFYFFSSIIWLFIRNRIGKVGNVWGQELEYNKGKGEKISVTTQSQFCRRSSCSVLLLPTTVVLL